MSAACEQGAAAAPAWSRLRRVSTCGLRLCLTHANSALHLRRFTTYMKNVRVGNFFGGLPIKQQREQLRDKDKCPHIIVGTPGRVKAVRACKTRCLCAACVQHQAAGSRTTRCCRSCQAAAVCCVAVSRVPPHWLHGCLLPTCTCCQPGMAPACLDPFVAAAGGREGA